MHIVYFLCRVHIEFLSDLHDRRSLFCRSWIRDELGDIFFLLVKHLFLLLVADRFPSLVDDILSILNDILRCVSNGQLYFIV